MRTRDLVVVFMGGDSPRLGHKPACIPPSPSVISIRAHISCGQDLVNHVQLLVFLSSSINVR